ncbi:hypothetical protein ACH5RR_014494 [Cinchona calisaya]|uniref:Aminotransferase-like plant mobile domain-containing protein n=1 Tax=Cinchona calisaya TaxID=153742 RepID=A0ABD3A322_9GENT
MHACTTNLSHSGDVEAQPQHQKDQNCLWDLISCSECRVTIAHFIELAVLYVYPRIPSFLANGDVQRIYHTQWMLKLSPNTRKAKIACGICYHFQNTPSLSNAPSLSVHFLELAVQYGYLRIPKLPDQWIPAAILQKIQQLCSTYLRGNYSWKDEIKWLCEYWSASTFEGQIKRFPLMQQCMRYGRPENRFAPEKVSPAAAIYLKVVPDVIAEVSLVVEPASFDVNRIFTVLLKKKFQTVVIGVSDSAQQQVERQPVSGEMVNSNELVDDNKGMEHMVVSEKTTVSKDVAMHSEDVNIKEKKTEGSESGFGGKASTKTSQIRILQRNSPVAVCNAYGPLERVETELVPDENLLSSFKCVKGDPVANIIHHEAWKWPMGRRFNAEDKLKRLALAAMVYEIWKARNASILRNKTTNAVGIVAAIIEVVGKVVAAWGKIQRNRRNLELTVEWSLPNSIFV